MMRTAGTLFAISTLALGCSFDESVVAEGDVAVPGDTDPADSVSDERCSGWQSALFFEPCDLPEPSEALELTAVGRYLYDTDRAVLTGPNGSSSPANIVAQLGDKSVRVVSVEGLVVGSSAELTVIGSRPLVLASWSDVFVGGSVAVDGSVYDLAGNLQVGAGSRFECHGQLGLTGSSNLRGAGGGAGGSYGSVGGVGGTGAQDGTPSIPGNPGGTALFDGWNPTLAGGCSGGAGGIGTAAGDYGAGGAGGGAIHLAALGTLNVDGAMSANGSGGGVGNDFGGGGGGGSGGLLSLESATEVVLGSRAELSVNGGGGGAGSAHGDPGELGISGVLGGSAGLAFHDHAGAGGFGAVAETAAEAGVDADDAGGGGGGGRGVIAIYEPSGTSRFDSYGAR